MGQGQTNTEPRTIVFVQMPWPAVKSSPTPPLSHGAHLLDEELYGDLHTDTHEEETHEQALVRGNVGLNLRQARDRGYDESKAS